MALVMIAGAGTVNKAVGFVVGRVLMIFFKIAGMGGHTVGNAW